MQSYCEILSNLFKLFILHWNLCFSQCENLFSSCQTKLKEQCTRKTNYLHVNFFMHLATSLADLLLIAWKDSILKTCMILK